MDRCRKCLSPSLTTYTHTHTDTSCRRLLRTLIMWVYIILLMNIYRSSCLSPKKKQHSHSAEFAHLITTLLQAATDDDDDTENDNDTAMRNFACKCHAWIPTAKWLALACYAAALGGVRVCFTFALELAHTHTHSGPKMDSNRQGFRTHARASFVCVSVRFDQTPLRRRYRFVYVDRMQNYRPHRCTGDRRWRPTHTSPRLFAMLHVSDDDALRIINLLMRQQKPQNNMWDSRGPKGHACVGGWCECRVCLLRVTFRVSLSLPHSLCLCLTHATATRIQLNLCYGWDGRTDEFCFTVAVAVAAGLCSREWKYTRHRRRVYVCVLLGDGGERTQTPAFWMVAKLRLTPSTTSTLRQSWPGLRLCVVRARNKNRERTSQTCRSPRI